jgi:hypothetical protein
VLAETERADYPIRGEDVLRDGGKKRQIANGPYSKFENTGGLGGAFGSPETQHRACARRDTVLLNKSYLRIVGLVIVAIECGCCASIPVQRPSVPRSLPYFRGIIVKPISDTKQITMGRYGSFQYTNKLDDARSGGPVVDEPRAIEIGLEWLDRHFGGVHKSRMALRRIARQERGSQIDYIVTLEQQWSGMPTSGFANIYIRGETVKTVVVRIMKFTAIPNTDRPCITSAAAMERYGNGGLGRGRPPAETVKSASPELVLVWSLEDYKYGDDGVHIPAWSFGKERRILVHAHTGKLFVDD